VGQASRLPSSTRTHRLGVAPTVSPDVQADGNDPHSEPAARCSIAEGDRCVECAPASGSPYPLAGRSPPPSRLRLTRICLRCAWRLSRRRRRPGVGSGLRSPGKARLPHAHVRAGGPVEYQPTEVGQANSGTMPGVRVKMAPLVKYAVSMVGDDPDPPPTRRRRELPAETVGAMRKSRWADTRLTPSAPSQLRMD
jgi:hypothetical protein